MKNSTNTVLAKLHTSKDFVHISTYDAIIGHRGTFIVPLERLSRWALDTLDGKPVGEFFSEDCGNILKVRHRPGEYIFTIWWMSRSGNSVKGEVREFTLDPVTFGSLYYDENTEKVTASLYEEPQKRSKVEFSVKASENIATMNKRERRAFTKFMRTAFRWGNTEITVFPDGKKSFYFRETEGICGGIIRSEYKGIVTYSMHT